jgi:hypothetical protein
MLLVVVIDDVSGPDVSVALLYLVPVFLISWAIGRGAGVTAAVICAVIWSALEVSPNVSHAAWWYVWNYATRVGVFTAFAVVVSRAKMVLRKPATDLVVVLKGVNIDEDFLRVDLDTADTDGPDDVPQGGFVRFT